MRGSCPVFVCKKNILFFVYLNFAKSCDGGKVKLWTYFGFLKAP